MNTLIARLWNPAEVSRDLRHPTLASFVDMARWMAATLVMFGHLRNPLLLGYNGLAADGRPVWVKAWYFVTGMHAEAVLVFFVLSGFLVGGLAAARWSEGRFDPSGYAVDRIARLFIAFLPALALTFALDWIGSHYLSASGLWDGLHPMLAEKDPGKIYGERLTLPILLGNIAMVQFYYVLPLGSNDPLWTLSSEFWFYAVFGLALVAAIATGTRRWAAAAAAVLACALLGPLFLGYFGMWLIGFAVACFPARRAGPPLLAFAVLVLYLSALRALSPYIDAWLLRKMAAHYGLALIFGWLIMALRGRRVAWLEALGRGNKFMADFSYSLYLIHFPVLMFIIAVLGRVTGIRGYFEGFAPTDPLGIASYAGIALALLILAWLFAQATERHTAWLRDTLKARLPGRSASRATPGLEHQDRPQRLGGVLAPGEMSEPPAANHSGVE